jgi:hypothetical protein
MRLQRFTGKDMAAQFVVCEKFPQRRTRLHVRTSSGVPFACSFCLCLKAKYSSAVGGFEPTSLARRCRPSLLATRTIAETASA